MDNQWVVGGAYWRKEERYISGNEIYPFFSAVSSCVVGGGFSRRTGKTRPLHFSQPTDCRIVTFLTNQIVLLPLFCQGDVEIVWLKLMVLCFITLLCLCLFRFKNYFLMWGSYKKGNHKLTVSWLHFLLSYDTTVEQTLPASLCDIHTPYDTPWFCHVTLPTFKLFGEVEH